MSSYDETIAAAKLAREAALGKVRDAAAQQKEQEDRAAAEAHAFLKTVVAPEVEKARAALEAAGMPAEIGNGQGADGIRCSLHITRQNKSLIFTAGFEKQHGGGARPKISAAGEPSDHYFVEMEQGSIEANIRAFLSKTINPKPKRD